MSGESLLIILVIGLIAGWLAGQIVRGMGFGLVADLGAQILHTVDRRNWKISLFLRRLERVRLLLRAGVLGALY
jgi:uncharacterized membrane protein YeaQ/YmgE (transglycosylase-associated protein family)